jgi:hypothetical protein
MILRRKAGMKKAVAVLIVVGSLVTMTAFAASSSGVASDSPVKQRVTYFKYCGMVKMPLGDGSYRMGVIKSGPITCTKAKRVWKRFRIWYDRNPGPGKVTILHFRCTTRALVSNARCVRGSRIVSSDLEMGTLPY